MSTFTITPLSTQTRPSGKVECIHPDLFSRISRYDTCPACGEFAKCGLPEGLVDLARDALTDEWDELVYDENVSARAEGRNDGLEDGRLDAYSDVDAVVDGLVLDLRGLLVEDEDTDGEIEWQSTVETVMEALEKRGWES